MTTKILYTGGGASLSPVQRDGSIDSDYIRIVADEGKAITNGTIVTTVIDVINSDVQNWSDCDLPPVPPEPEPAIDDSEAIEILLGRTE